MKRISLFVKRLPVLTSQCVRPFAPSSGYCVQTLLIWSELLEVLFLSTLDDMLKDHIIDLVLAGFHLLVV